MEGFQERVIAEKEQLDERTNKLDAFIDTAAFGKLPQAQQALLKVQLHSMKAYSECLSQRLGLLQ